MSFYRCLFVLTTNLISNLNAQTTSSPKPYASPYGLAQDITLYLAASTSSQAVFSKNLMLNNINIPGSANGTVIAAQSYSNPNYAYNWVRDASLTMDVVASLYSASSSST